jgi:hypothetical protein
MSPEGRREVILRAAVSLTQHAGCIDSWSRQDVANKCVPPTSHDTVKHYYLMPDLRDAVRALLDK